MSLQGELLRLLYQGLRMSVRVARIICFNYFLTRSKYFYSKMFSVKDVACTILNQTLDYIVLLLHSDILLLHVYCIACTYVV